MFFMRTSWNTSFSPFSVSFILGGIVWPPEQTNTHKKTHTVSFPLTPSPPLTSLPLYLPSCPRLLLFPITNNSAEFPSLLSWGIFITAQSPCPEGLPALNCSTAVLWTLSSKTGPLFTNTRRTQGGDSVSTSTAPETKLPYMWPTSGPTRLGRERPDAQPSPLLVLDREQLSVGLGAGEKRCWRRYPIYYNFILSYFSSFCHFSFVCPADKLSPQTVLVPS